MPDKTSVLIDLNVILDVLQKREPYFNASMRILSKCETGNINGFIASHSLTTLFYLIRKDKSTSDARAIHTSLLQFLKVAPVDQNTIEQALNLEYKDFEDAVQMIAALQCKVDYLITRNIRDYHPSLIPTIQPADLILLLK